MVQKRLASPLSPGSFAGLHTRNTQLPRRIRFGGEGRVRGGFFRTLPESKARSSGLPATFSPWSRGEGTVYGNFKNKALGCVNAIVKCASALSTFGFVVRHSRAGGNPVPWTRFPPARELRTTPGQRSSWHPTGRCVSAGQNSRCFRSLIVRMFLNS